MVVSITIPPPGNVIGPGLPISLITDLSPLPTNWEWVVNVYQDAAHLHQAFQQIAPSFPSVGFTLGTQGFGYAWSQASGGILQQDVSAFTRVTVVDTSNGQVKDSTNQTFTWDPIAGLNNWLILNGSSIGGLTGTQAAQLTDIQNKTTDTIDALTIPVGTPAVATPLSALLAPTVSSDLVLEELTSGPTGSFVGATLGAFVNAIIVRIAAVPPDLIPRTPDGDYYVPTLATVRIFHGADLYLRVPIHTTSKIIELQPSFWGTAIAAIETAIWPNAVTLQVQWLPGVTGQVYKSRSP